VHQEPASNAVERHAETEARLGTYAHAATHTAELARESGGGEGKGEDEAAEDEAASTAGEVPVQDRLEGAELLSDKGQVRGGTEGEEKATTEEEEEEMDQDEAGGLVIDEESEDDDVSLLAADKQAPNRNTNGEGQGRGGSEAGKAAAEEEEASPPCAKDLPVALELRQPADAAPARKQEDRGSQGGLAVDENEDEDDDDEEELRITDAGEEDGKATRKRLRQADSDDDADSLQDGGGESTGHSSRSLLAVQRARAMVKKERTHLVVPMHASEREDAKKRSRPHIASESDEDEDVPLAGPPAHAKRCPCITSACISIPCMPCATLLVFACLCPLYARMRSAAVQGV